MTNNGLKEVPAGTKVADFPTGYARESELFGKDKILEELITTRDSLRETQASLRKLLAAARVISGEPLWSTKQEALRNACDEAERLLFDHFG